MRQNSSSQYDNFTQEMVFKRLLTGDTGEDCMLIVPVTQKRGLWAGMVVLKGLVYNGFTFGGLLVLRTFFLTFLIWGMWWSCKDWFSLLASHDGKGCTNVVTWYKSDVTPCVNCLDPTNVVVPLMMMLASHDANTGANGVTWINFDCVDLMNAVVLLTMPLVPQDTKSSTNGITWPKMSCCTLFQSCSSNKCNDTIAEAISIMFANAAANGVTWPKVSHCT